MIRETGELTLSQHIKTKTKSNSRAHLEIFEFDKTEKPKNSSEEHMHVHEHPIIYHPSHTSDGFTMKYYLKIQSDFGLFLSFPRSLLLKSGPEGPETYPAPDSGPNISRTRFFQTCAQCAQGLQKPIFDYPHLGLVMCESETR